jgi:hypothetical protein
VRQSELTSVKITYDKMASDAELRNRKRSGDSKKSKKAVERTSSADVHDTNEATEVDGITWKLDRNNAIELEQRQRKVGEKVFRRAVKRVLLLSFALLTVYLYRRYTEEAVTDFASVRQTISRAPLSLRLACSVPDYKKDSEQWPECAPRRCGRVVTDALVSQSEAERLLQFAQRAFDLTKSNGSASILGLLSSLTFLNVLLRLIAFFVFNQTCTRAPCRTAIAS